MTRTGHLKHARTRTCQAGQYGDQSVDSLGRTLDGGEPSDPSEGSRVMPMCEAPVEVETRSTRQQPTTSTRRYAIRSVMRPMESQ
jgi:hypothetical protein